MKKLALIASVIGLLSEYALALGLDYPPGMRLVALPNWPSGLANLRDSQHWVYGFGVAFAEDIFFYAGDTDSFNGFVTRYAALPVASHTLALHRGKGVAKSPWNRGPGLRCDWKMYIAPRWREAGFNKSAVGAQKMIRDNPGYTVGLELWLNGGVDFAEVTVPANVTVVLAEEESRPNAASGKAGTDK